MRRHRGAAVRGRGFRYDQALAGKSQLIRPVKQQNPQTRVGPAQCIDLTSYATGNGSVCMLSGSDDGAKQVL